MMFLRFSAVAALGAHTAFGMNNPVPNPVPGQCIANQDVLWNYLGNNGEKIYDKKQWDNHCQQQGEAACEIWSKNCDNIKGVDYRHNGPEKVIDGQIEGFQVCPCMWQPNNPVQKKPAPKPVPDHYLQMGALGGSMSNVIHINDFSERKYYGLRDGQAVTFNHHQTGERLYWEKQKWNYCGCHALNAFFQEKRFSVEQLHQRAEQLVKEKNEQLENQYGAGTSRLDYIDKKGNHIKEYFFKVEDMSSPHRGYDFAVDVLTEQMADEGWVIGAGQESQPSMVKTTNASQLMRVLQEGDGLLVNDHGNHYYTYKRIGGKWYNLNSAGYPGERKALTKNEMDTEVTRMLGDGKTVFTITKKQGAAQPKEEVKQEEPALSEDERNLQEAIRESENVAPQNVAPQQEEVKQEEKEETNCPFCTTVNPKTAKTCSTCGELLDNIAEAERLRQLQEADLLGQQEADRLRKEQEIAEAERRRQLQEADLLGQQEADRLRKEQEKKAEAQKKMHCVCDLQSAVTKTLTHQQCLSPPYSTKHNCRWVQA